jgi:hypothetical protein
MAKKKSAKKATKKPGKRTTKKSAKLPSVPPIEGALIMLAAFLELADDEEVDPDSAVSAMEGMSATLQECSSAERKRLQVALQALTTEEESEEEPREELIEFYKNFFKNLGLGEE